jgi:hypothetical protein
MAYDIGYAQPPKPASQSRTLQGLALAAAATVAPIILQRRPPNMGELVKLAGLGLGLWGRLRPGAGQPLTVG